MKPNGEIVTLNSENSAFIKEGNFEIVNIVIISHPFVLLNDFGKPI